MALLAPAPAGSAVEAGAVTGEVVVSVWQVITPGMGEKKGCRTRVVVTNNTSGDIGLYAKFHTLDGAKEIDTWYLSAANIRPTQNTERLYSCIGAAVSVGIDDTARASGPHRCVINGIDSSPCAAKLRVESNLRVVGR